MTTTDILSRIDTALAGAGTVDYGETDDSMRWRPGLVICDGGGTLRPYARQAPARERPVFTVCAHYRTGSGFFVCVRAEVYSDADRAATAAKMAKARRPYPGWRPRPASRCGDCNPHGNPEPLAVDGRDYQRRLRNRRRRRGR